MKVRWSGGPLDGCVDEVTRPTAIWYGPDIEDPKGRVVVYVLLSDGTYEYRQALTDKANEVIAASEEQKFQSLVETFREDDA